MREVGKWMRGKEEKEGMEQEREGGRERKRREERERGGGRERVRSRGMVEERGGRGGAKM